MSLHNTFSTIYADYRRYRTTGTNGFYGFLQVILFTQAFWATCVYRCSHNIYINVNTPIIRPILRLFFMTAHKITEIVTGISLPARCIIGKGLYIGHFGHIILHPDTRIGENCNLSQGITIGYMQRGKRQGTPKLGNRIFVGPNAVIIGDIFIGDDAAIGAGAIVTQSVPPMGVVAGNPARIISYQGSFELIRFDDMDNDPERLLALQHRATNVIHEKNSCYCSTTPQNKTICDELLKT